MPTISTGAPPPEPLRCFATASLAAEPPTFFNGGSAPGTPASQGDVKKEMQILHLFFFSYALWAPYIITDN